MFQTIKLFKSFFLYPKKEVTECRSESNRNYSISELDKTTVHIKPYLFWDMKKLRLREVKWLAQGHRVFEATLEWELFSQVIHHPFVLSVLWGKDLSFCFFGTQCLAHKGAGNTKLTCQLQTFNYSCGLGVWKCTAYGSWMCGGNHVCRFPPHPIPPEVIK